MRWNQFIPSTDDTVVFVELLYEFALELINLAIFTVFFTELKLNNDTFVFCKAAFS